MQLAHAGLFEPEDDAGLGEQFLDTNILMNQKRIPADRVKWENKLDKPKKWGKESYNLRQNYTCAECPKGGEPGPLGVKDGQLTPRVHIRETAPQERSPTWALHT